MTTTIKCSLQSKSLQKRFFYSNIVYPKNSNISGVYTRSNMFPYSIHYDLINKRDVYSTVYYAALVWHYYMQSILFYCISFCMHCFELFLGITLTGMKFVPKPSNNENPVLNLKSSNRFKTKPLRINHISVLILDCVF